MASINHFIASGRITRDAEDLTNGGGFKCRFHVNVPARNGRSLWLCCHFHGNKAAEMFDDLVEGTLVTIQGSLGARDAEQAGAIHVTTMNVICEAHDGSDLEMI